MGTEAKAAVKQFAKGNDFKNKADVESCQAEIEIGNMLFGTKGAPRDSEGEYPGVHSVAAYLDLIEDAKDIWLIYELGGASLSKLLFDVKGEFFKGERLYHVSHMPFYAALKAAPGEFLGQFLRRLFEALDLLQHRNIIHADLKPDNILVAVDSSNRITGLKLIDFGSAFFYDRPCSLRMSTPEYLPPECLELMVGSAKPNSHSSTSIT